MVTLTTGDLLQSKADALVNPVNCFGVMGKGLALQFKNAFPENFRVYKAACQRGEVRPGRMFFTSTEHAEPRLIVNFPTKRHWRERSRLEDIQNGLIDLIRVVKAERIVSIAVPALGCGLGGLRWEDVRPPIEEAFAEVSEVKVYLFAPEER